VTRSTRYALAALVVVGVGLLLFLAFRPTRPDPNLDLRGDGATGDTTARDVQAVGGGLTNTVAALANIGRAA
jgi:hypothetical protein